MSPSSSVILQGLHLTADLQDCRCKLALLQDEVALANLAKTHAERSGLHVVSELWHRFPAHSPQGGGVTGVLLLAESHLALHTWPEMRSLTLDVYVCNFLSNNNSKARALMDALVREFDAQEISRVEWIRGEVPTALPQV